ncbi:DUF3850 domain-containing protein [Flavobacterium psychrophilum]|nr:DUF3850 domain-containing protein [Flavobacterium psychrophilum]EKT4510517.1 DUF3850 domain-containing protein [Flavobacterium psychrophilum]
MTHELKIVPEYFKDAMLGLKKFEIRFNDRNYQVGDTLILNEFNPKTERYTGEQVTRKVDYILDNVNGLQADYVILQISKPL